MYTYITNRKIERNLVLSLFLLTLASATIYSNLVVIACFGLYIALVDISLPKVWVFVKKNTYWLLILSLVCLYLAYSFARVTADGLPLFGSSDHNFFKAIPLSFAEMFTSIELVKMVLIMIVVAILVGGLVIQNKHLEKIPFTGILLGTLLMTYLIAVVLKKPLPTARVLLPIYPILVLAICETIPLLEETISGRATSKLFVIGVGIITILLLVNYVGSINLTYTTDWKDNYPLKTSVYLSAIDHNPPPDINNPVVQFYIRQMEEHYHRNYESLFGTTK